MAQKPDTSGAATPWYNYGVTQGFGQHGETGVDLGTPFHTPLTDLYPGTVEFAGKTRWNSGGTSGGAVAIRTDAVPGQGQLNEIYLHVDQLAPGIGAGSHVQQGDYIALSGGQNSGGQWPADRQFSSGPHTEFDLFPGPQSGDINAIWSAGYQHPINPTPYLAAASLFHGAPPLAAGNTSNNPSSGGVSLADCIARCGPNTTCISACLVAGGNPAAIAAATACAPWDIGCIMSSIFTQDHVMRGVLVISGFAVALFGLNRLTHGGVQNAVTQLMPKAVPVPV